MSVLPLESQLFKMLQDSHKFEASHELLNETLSNKKQNKAFIWFIVNILIILVNKEFFVVVRWAGLVPPSS